MGIKQYHQDSHLDCSFQSNSTHHQYQPNLLSLSSQPSLRSIPSFTSQPNHSQNPDLHYYCVTTLKGHTSYISSLTVAGKLLYSGSSDKEIRSWRRNPSAEFESSSSSVVAIGEGAVKSLLVLADKLFSAHQDHKIRVWKLSIQEPDEQKCTHLATLPTFGDRASKIILPKNQVKIRRHKTCTWVHHVDTVSALALSRDESLLYSVSWDRTLKVWRISDFKCMESVTNAHDDAINAVACSNDADVYTGSADRKIKVWRRVGQKKHSLVATLEKNNSGINALALNKDGSVLYSGACDRSIVVWQKDDAGDMVAVGALRGHARSILCLVVVSDFLCSGSADNTVRIWRGSRGNFSCVAVLEGHKGPIKCLTATVDRCDQSNTSLVIYSGSLDCNIKVWQVSVPLP
ncbi:hypothetical protein K2173_022843 [Erythroxylum novogranatense]|uniref:Uncharacterized protein n=1 Tax=Erythroxylum novogranatense TaxID=1862640 RepID=A0AAV8SMT6_9ROSI|nr:hypothetical protein K2173_022843 [Erythroxylum novogranatense]